MNAIKVEELSKFYKAVSAINNLSVNIEAGKRTAIIGPNGAGKTTFINLITGVLKPTSGKISIFDKDVTNMSLYKRAHLGLSRSFQINSLFFELSVLDNTILSFQGNRMSSFRLLSCDPYRKQDLIESERILEPINFWPKRNTLVKNLSHGEQRQLEIVLSLGSGAKLLLLDEPSSGLAPMEIAVLVNLIKNLPEGVTVVFSAHDLEFVFDLAQYVIILNYGELVIEGKPADIKLDSRARELYLGETES
jgi:branched-chain amino acid transport system ATP-binding protein